MLMCSFFQPTPALPTPAKMEEPVKETETVTLVNVNLDILEIIVKLSVSFNFGVKLLRMQYISIITFK